MKITLHRPIYVDAETGVARGNITMDDERRAKQLIDRGLAGEGWNAKAADADLNTRALSGAPKTRAAKKPAAKKASKRAAKKS